ncbi:MAG: TIGR03560 family F420-dependent LLM class oxidoreductase [Acidimicrobiia bacterium]|nr:TIGR03560 family F420-dependent LLM class oxidoreductase [Acidimicrobiia bacterium]
MHFGVHTGLQNTNIAELTSLWQRSESHGFEWISIWDHFYAADGTGNAHSLEAVASHAALAASTSRVRCGSLVYSAGYRHPAVLANAMATLDQIADGRITLGLGAGWMAAEYRAYGMDFEPTGVRLARLEESIQCVRGLLTQDTTSFSGAFYTLDDARCEPKPVQQRLPIWIGGGGEKVTLRIAARHADGWNVPFIAPDAFAHKVEVLNRHCETADRDPSTITRAINVGIAFQEEDLHAQYGKMANFVRPGVLMGSVAEMCDRVGAYREAGAEWLMLSLRSPFDIEGLDRFAAEVLPALK